MRIVDGTIYTIFIACFIASLLPAIEKEDSGTLIAVQWLTVSWSISLVNLFSICRIRSYIKKLELDQGIFANEKFIIIYNCFFFGVSISRTISTVLVLASFRSVDFCTDFDDSINSASLYKLNIADIFFLICSNVSFYGAHICMLIMIIRYSRQLDEPKSDEVALKFQRAFSDHTATLSHSTRCSTSLDTSAASNQTPEKNEEDGDASCILIISEER